MNIRRILLSLAVLVFAGSVVAGGTGAFFSDEERSEGNMFTAGAIDLTVDSVAHYNGMICFDSGENFSDGYEWHPAKTLEWVGPTVDEDGFYQLIPGTDLDEAIDEFNEANVALVPQAGDDCTGTWALRDLGDDQVGPATTFFSYGDLKPGDSGENTISLHVENNDAWACVIVDEMVDYENGCTEPEGNADEYPDGELPDNTCAGSVDTPMSGEGEGELSTEVNFFAWADDGDNDWEAGELPLFNNPNGVGAANDVINGRVYDLFSPANGMGPMSASDTKYIGMYWCYGDIEVDTQTNTLTCDGAPVTNRTQTDALEADITFYVEQARNNPNFDCASLLEEEPQIVVTEGDADTVVGSGFTETVAARFKSFANTGSKELYVGFHDLGVGGNRVEQDYTWASGETPVVVGYDEVNDEVYGKVGGNPTLTKLANPDACPVGEWDTVQISVVNRDIGTTVNLNDVVVDTIALGDFVGAGWNNWTLTGYAFGSGFELTADLELAGTFTGDEVSKVEVLVGCDGI